MSSNNYYDQIEDDYFHTYGVYVGYVDAESITNFRLPNKNLFEQVSNKILDKDENSVCLLLISFEYDKLKKKYFALIREVVTKTYTNIFDPLHNFEDELEFNNKIILKNGVEVNFCKYENDDIEDEDSNTELEYEYNENGYEVFEFEKFGHLYHGTFELYSREVFTMFIGEKSKLNRSSKIERPIFRFRFVSFRPTPFNSGLFI
jgi:hypothetical protein